ncbi:hypothetical protein [Lysinibacillus sp. FJAT-14222]|uniref:hypothetical protein n=1 Tax=Lysinibacillus sp. FJAT-14222 TaxID=1932366 RepID=UPI0006B011B0|nr:hypothetical protein [Lysinibacillus sp. FJAT-14222]KOS63836.1 hypothetical protein AN161_04385 [Lysinibacillus sp. FJAT-14222]
MKNFVLILFIVFCVTGFGTLWTGLNFPIEIQNEKIASIFCLVIAAVFLIIYYILKSKEIK